MVKEKLSVFIKQFDYLFANKECPIIINTFGISDDSNILKGLIQFIIDQYTSKPNNAIVQRIELHEYVYEILNASSFEKLNRLGTDDLIISELSNYNIKIDDNDKFTAREIIHQLFTRVTFYKHNIADIENIEYCHIAFYQMQTGVTLKSPNTKEMRVELSLDGLISIPSTSNRGNCYDIGFGTQGASSTTSKLFDAARFLNELYANEEMRGSKNQFQHNCCRAKTYQFNQDTLLNKIYDSSNWVTF